jgi:hypothetical protein
LEEAHGSSAAYEKDADGGKPHVCERDRKAVGWVLRCRLSLSNCDHRHCRSREIAARRMRVTKWQTKPTIVLPDINSDFDALRIKTEDGSTITAENVRDEPQPAQLFEIPPGFRKFDPLNLIQRIKPSDVWVAGENDRAR